MSSRARSPWRGFLSALGASIVVGGCQGGYPIAATRCDHWCDVRQNTECGGYNPANCVVGCEAEFGSKTECTAHFDVLLACLDALPSSKLGCWYYGENQQPPCNTELTELYACVAPRYPYPGE